MKTRDLWAMFFLGGCCASFSLIFLQLVSVLMPVLFMFACGVIAVIITVERDPIRRSRHDER